MDSKLLHWTIAIILLLPYIIYLLIPINNFITPTTPNLANTAFTTIFITPTSHFIGDPTGTNDRDWQSEAYRFVYPLYSLFVFLIIGFIGYKTQNWILIAVSGFIILAPTIFIELSDRQTWYVFI